MKLKNATIEQLRDALETVNKERGYSLYFDRIEKSGKNVVFTIKSPSGVSGARVSARGRNLACASWHAHGYLFDKILEIAPDAIIESAVAKIDRNGGNWQDANIGSSMYPRMYSQTSIL